MLPAGIAPETRVGPAFNLGIFKGPGIDTLQASPAAGFVFNKWENWSLGLLNQNWFSDQVAVSAFQPILVYAPSPVWTFSLGDFPFVYDWNSGNFAVFTLGFQVGALLKIAGEPVRFFVNPQFNTRSNTKLYHWVVASGITLPLSSLMPH